MAGFERGSPQWGFTSYLLLILFGALVYKTGPLDSDRPLQDNEGRQNIPLLNVAPARLWQDPFESILKHRKNLKSNSSDLFESHHPKDKLDPNHPFYESDPKTKRFNESLKVVGVMVNAGPYAEIVERRKRRRYAVISGLAQLGYIPEQTNYINYFNWTAAKPTNIDTYDYVPYEWFHNNDKSRYLLILWLQDESFIQNPNDSFDSLVKTFSIQNGLIKNEDIRFIGPATSNLLKKIVNLDEKLPYTFLSPTATVPKQQLGDKEIPDNIIRTIATDDQLAKGLVSELIKRRLILDDENRGWWSPNITSQFALISEHDTVFGRAMPNLIAKELCKEVNDLKKCEQMHVYSYLRGIDGITLQRSSDAVQKKTKNQAEQKKQQRQPVGSSQYDYLRRLAIQMQEDERSFRKEGRGGMRFIGIFGNDVYDKLLILKAVRPYFPNAVFFTTDLDARLLQESEYTWSRNLVIASGYGLRLKPERQGNIPPFRDSYQTSVFHTMQMVLKSEQGLREKYSKGKIFQPLIFEIGRKSAVRITNNKEGSEQQEYFHDDVSPKESVRPEGKILVVIFIVLLAGIFAYYHTALVHHRVRVVKWLFAIWLVMALLTYFAYELSCEQEPFSFTDGVSVWPTIYIRSIAALLAIYLLTNSLSKLKKNYHHLSVEYFGLSDNSFPVRGSAWQAGFLVFLAVIVFVACMIFINRYYFLTSIMVWSVLIGFSFWFILCKLKVKNVGNWAGERVKNNDELAVTKLWFEYGDYGQTYDRFFRSLAITIIYLSVACILFMLLGSANVPSRGMGMFVIDKIVLVPAIIGLMLLLFLIVDETRLCTTWIYKFIDRKLVWTVNSQNKLEKYDTAYHSYVSEWLSVQLIAERTQVVGKLVYYPFFIIVLMLLSRSTYFDNWSFPVPLVIIFGANVLIAIFCAIRLRQTAEKARSNALNVLTTHIIELKSKEVAPKPIGLTKSNLQKSDFEQTTKPQQPRSIVTSEQKIKLIETLIKDINAVNIGAFQPLRDQPFVRATIVVFGAAGLTITEYLRLSS